MGKASKDQLDERLRDTERLLVRRRSYSDVERELSGTHKVSKRTARKWITAVRARWRAEADTETADDSRAALIAQLDAVIASAWSHAEVVKNDDGTVVVDMDPSSRGYGKPVLKPAPKHQQVLHAVTQLRALLGADKPNRTIVTLDGDLNMLPDLPVLPETVEKQLRSALQAIAPGGDLRQLAGEWFKQETPEGK